MAKTSITVGVQSFEKLSAIMEHNLKVTSKKIVNKLESWVERKTGIGGKHYTERTGNLKRATKVEGDLKKKIEMYVDRGMVDYGKWILTGKRRGKSGIVTWNGGRGDPYIDEAFEVHKEWIEKVIDDAIQNAIVEWDSTALEEVT